MREIKFRAWNKVQKVMFFPDGMDLKKKSLMSIDRNPFYVKLISGWNKGGGFELMQYTGLKDKNGKEIYEGDILRSDALGDDGEGVVSLVIFEKGCFVYGEGDGCPIKDYVYMDTVIGNIYENPELKILFGVK